MTCFGSFCDSLQSDDIIIIITIIQKYKCDWLCRRHSSTIKIIIIIIIYYNLFLFNLL
jgi:hypothetical protein